VDSNKRIIEEIVRQFGYLPELQKSEIIHTLTDSRKQRFTLLFCGNLMTFLRPSHYMATNRTAVGEQCIAAKLKGRKNSIRILGLPAASGGSIETKLQDTASVHICRVLISEADFKPRGLY